MGKLNGAYALASSVCLGLCAPLALASDLQWNGFMSAGGGMASEDGLAGYDEDLSFNNETILGLQLKGSISDKLSATGQLVARGTEDMKAEMAWAYLSYAATDNTTLRLGRFRTPFYLYSDFLEVGYAYHWISPPSDVYSLPADSIDGIDIVNNSSFAGIDLTTQFYVGSINSGFTQGGEEIDTRIRDQAGLALTFNWEWLTLRLSHHEAQKVSFNGLENVYVDPAIGTIGDLQDALNAMSAGLNDPGYTQAANNLSVQDERFTFDEMGVKVEWNNLLVVAEMTQLKADSGPLGQQNRAYVSVGYTFGPVMLHVTQSQANDDAADIADTITVLDPAIYGPTLAAQTAGMAMAVDGLAQNFVATDRTTNTVGMRWDFTPGAAFKLEVSDIDDATDADASGQIYRFVVDTVF
ncbi:hypothetical protein [Agaribacterium sp. ZY112]|uniref:hypothetical protein n=1 Tax=Agaribacterium sp. ZY112 TaxID=3233574 RepID=UPI0035237538